MLDRLLDELLLRHVAPDKPEANFLARIRSAVNQEECALLARCQVLTLMNALNELMKLGASRLAPGLAARFAALPSGSLVLLSDQAAYRRCQQGMALLQQLLTATGARLLRRRTTAADQHEMGNRFRRTARLDGVYGEAAGPDGPATRYYRVWNRQLQLVALLP